MVYWFFFIANVWLRRLSQICYPVWHIQFISRHMPPWRIVFVTQYYFYVFMVHHRMNVNIHFIKSAISVAKTPTQRWRQGRVWDGCEETFVFAVTNPTWLSPVAVFKQQHGLWLMHLKKTHNSLWCACVDKETGAYGFGIRSFSKYSPVSPEFPVFVSQWWY